MKICIIGGTGHIGRNLVNMLLAEGHDITVITSGRIPLPQDDGWDRITAITCSYGGDGWAECLGEQRAEVVIDILGHAAPDVYATVKPACGHFILCGSVWMFGEPRSVPTPDETQGPCPFEGYAKRYEEMQQLQAQAAKDGIPFTAIMPPNICGPRKIPLEGLGGRSLDVHKSHQRGEPVPLPAPGSNLVGPCDAEDIAQAFALAAANRDAADGEIFNVGAAYALTAPQFIAAYGDIYGVEIPIDWQSWEQYSTESVPGFGSNFHFSANMCPDISKLRSKLGYEPRYTPEQTMARAVDWMRDEGML
jgi:nucleoside-diphosphate-sugar epimerase